MVFNSKTIRVSLEPGDTIRCKNADDAGKLADVLSQRKIPWELVYEKDGVSGIWIEIIDDEESKDGSNY